MKKTFFLSKMQQSIGENIIVENSIWFFKCQSKCWKNKKTDQLWQVQWRCYEIYTRYFKINISRNARKCYDERKTCRSILSDMQNLEFHLLLPPPHFTNPNSFPLCFPIKIKKKSDSKAHIEDDLITVNSFFTYKVKEIQIMETAYKFFQQILHIKLINIQTRCWTPAGKISRNNWRTTTVQQKKVSYVRNVHKWPNNSTNSNNRTGDNLDNSTDKFPEIINKTKICKIPLRYFYNLGKVNYPVKINFKIFCFLEIEIKKLFESKKQVNAIAAPDIQIIFNNAHFLQYEQFCRNDYFEQYVETIMYSENVLRMGIQKTRLQKIYEMAVGSQSFNIDFRSANRQFQWLEIFYVFDKSNKNNTI